MGAYDIPINNVYYMLCYTWKYLKPTELVDLANTSCSSMLNLLSNVLVHGVEHLARRGLEQGYETCEEEVAGIRGRMDVLRSARRFLPQHGKAACSFDELSVDTLPNQIINSTFRLLCNQDELDADIRQKIQRIRRELSAISDITISSQTFRKVQLHGNNRYYRFLLSVCQLIHGNTLVEPQSGKFRFYDFVRDERIMAGIFQNFLYQFSRQEIRGWQTVSRNHIPWDASSETDPDLALLPRMETDITFRKAGWCRIVDAKYYRKTLAERYETEKYHVAHLYQLLTYLANYRAKENEMVSGMLIYPLVDRPLSECYQIKGFDVAMHTVDLNQPWQHIHHQLIDILQ